MKAMIMRTNFLLVLAILGSLSMSAQSQNDSSTSENQFFDKLVAYSRPGSYHQLLAALIGTWNWKGGEHSGSLVRRSFANGRFFLVESTSSKEEKLMQSPARDEKMEETTFQTLELEGYDNVKHKFIKSLVNNHIGSFIASYEGTYDSTTKTIVYESEVELIPGTKWKVYQHLIFIDKDNYKIEDYRQENNANGKVNEAFYTRVKNK